MRDDKADEIVSQHENLQAAIRGVSIMLVLPGHGAHMLATAGMLFGWMCSSLAAYSAWTRSPTFLPYYFTMSLVALTAMSVLIYRVMRGSAGARSRVYGFTVVLVVVSIASMTMALISGERAVIILSGAGVLASLAAARCVAGASYALFAAFFRAKRAYANQLEAEHRSTVDEENAGK